MGNTVHNKGEMSEKRKRRTKTQNKRGGKARAHGRRSALTEIERLRHRT